MIAIRIRDLSRASLVLAALLAGCGDHHDGSGAADTWTGMNDMLSGLALVDHGLAQYRASERPVAVHDMESGMWRMSQGLSAMRSGLGAMSEQMMSRCGGSRQAWMGPLEASMGELRAGHAMMTDSAATNDADGLARMDKARRSAGDAMSVMSVAMSCMAHDSRGCD
ncbi:MAG: hypothetical protein HYV09_35205 [Deltaproteobacteria bacterium]|nr:hypothetical protein [Deltaproteobacteria bacterium]